MILILIINGYNTFNIPLLIDNKFIEGSNRAGTIKSAGLPNIKGSFIADNQITDGGNDPTTNESFGETYITEISGPFENVVRRQWATIEDTNSSYIGNMTCGFRFDASKCSPIYNNSSTVQPHSITLLPLIKYI